MKKINFKNLDKNLKLSRSELKSIVGGSTACQTNEDCIFDVACVNGYCGESGAGYSCSCKLKTSQGVEAIFEIELTNPSGVNCSSACETHCNAANNIGGDCASHFAVFTIAT